MEFKFYKRYSENTACPTLTEGVLLSLLLRTKLFPFFLHLHMSTADSTPAV
jgi:hypothetical protein